MLWYERSPSNVVLIEITQGYERLVSLEEYIKGKYDMANEDLFKGAPHFPFENYEESIVERSHQIDEEAPHFPIEEDEKAIEDLVAPPQEQSNDEESHQALEEHMDESPHVSIEYQAHEENLIGDSTHASISTPHEDEGLVSYGLYQISEFDDLFMGDFEGDNLEDKPLNDDKFANAFTSPCYLCRYPYLQVIC
jgi:hypothetical protein